MASDKIVHLTLPYEVEYIRPTWSAGETRVARIAGGYHAPASCLAAVMIGRAVEHQKNILHSKHSREDVEEGLEARRNRRSECRRTDRQ